jgi:hypothetical protein
MTMNSNMQHDNSDHDMPAEIDFASGKRGQFYQAGVQLNFPVYLEQQVQRTLAALASAKGVDFSVLINELLKKDIELIEMAR